MPAKQKPSAIDPSPESEPSQTLLVFPVADRWFALPLESVRAVLTANILQPLAGSLDDLVNGWPVVLLAEEQCGKFLPKGPALL